MKLSPLKFIFIWMRDNKSILLTAALVVSSTALAAMALLTSVDASAVRNLTCPPAQGARIPIASNDQLQASLRCAASGVTLALKPGNYGTVTINGLHGVALVSEDAKFPATFERLSVRNSQDISLSHLRFAGPRAAAPFRLDIWDSRSVTASDLEFHGTIGRYDDTTISAVYIRASQKVELTQLEIIGPPDGISFQDVAGIVISRSYIHDFQSDGIVGTGSSDVEVGENYITGSHPQALDHPDAIQLFTANTTQSAVNISIANNLIERGNGGLMQGIFLNDERQDRPFKNVRIENNVIIGTNYNGIAIGGGEGVAILDNLVAPLPDQKNWIRIERTKDLQMRNNSAETFLMDGAIMRHAPSQGGNRIRIASNEERTALVKAWKDAHLSWKVAK